MATAADRKATRSNLIKMAAEPIRAPIPAVVSAAICRLECLFYRDDPNLDRNAELAWGVRDLDRVLQTKPDQPLALAAYGRLQFYAGNERSARDAFDAAVAAEAGLPEIHVWRAEAQRLWNHADIIRTGEDAIHLHPGPPDSWYECLVRAHASRGDLQTMSKYDRRLVEPSQAVLLLTRLLAPVPQPDRLGISGQRGAATPKLDREWAEFALWALVKAARDSVLTERVT